MNKWAGVRQNGMVYTTVTFSDDAYEPPANPDGSYYVRIAIDIDDATIVKSYYNTATNEFTPLPPKPADGFYQFDLNSTAWVPDVSMYRREALRIRQKLLAESDYTQLPDSPTINKTEWADYRQALRDITMQPGYPVTVNWPISPQA